MLAEVWKPDQEIIGENIRKARKAAYLTQEQLAEEMGGSCSNKVISRYESGISSPADEETDRSQAAKTLRYGNILYSKEIYVSLRLNSVS